MRGNKPDRTDVPPILLFTREEAARRLQAQIDKGLALRAKPIDTADQYEEAQAEKSKWYSYNKDLLRRMFDSPEVAYEYDAGIGKTIPYQPSNAWLLEDLRSDISRYIVRLESIRDRLELTPEKHVGPSHEEVTTPTTGIGNDVFIVHGHDEAAEVKAARAIEQLGLNPVILHEKPRRGQTVVEKLEKNSNVGFAVVLLTPDDVGAPRGRPNDLKPRARQNVILELGYFFGKLTRKRVCTLYSEGVDLPSDWEGVNYIQMDTAGLWRYELADELKAAGYDIDKNKLQG